MNTVRRKLAGEHPSEILIAELTAKHAGQKYWGGLQARCLAPGCMCPWMHRAHTVRYFSLSLLFSCLFKLCVRLCLLAV